MSDTVIKVENLSKKYILSHRRQERYTALRDVIARGANNIGKKLLSPLTSQKSTLPATQEEFYALKDVSFEVRQGDRVGIIGRNGAGKSTLLKVLSRITEPTNGWVEITGRVASLLEVGTGFHPELTGRENIFLNGAILGMTKAEIRKKFDQIVDFAEIEKFLDTPVKRYSSGMYVRLAFAVAAHLESEILIVDEVLAVGDAQFQKKCMGKMEEASKDGRTVLFVSHNMGAIQGLCSRAVLLKSGEIQHDGAVVESIKRYLSGTADSMDIELNKRSDRIGNGLAICLELVIKKGDGTHTNYVDSCDTVYFALRIQATRPLKRLVAGINIESFSGQRVATLWSGFNGEIFDVSPGEFWLENCVPELALAPADYFLTVTLGDEAQAYDVVERARILHIMVPRQRTLVRIPEVADHGAFLPVFSWTGPFPERTVTSDGPAALNK